MTDKKIFSNYIVESLDDRTHSTYARVTVKAPGGDVTVDPIGLPLIFDDTDAFVLYENTSDISALTNDSTLPDGSPVCIMAGPAAGAGVRQDVTITAAGVEMTVMFRDGTAVMDRMDYGLLDVNGVVATGTTPALAAKQAEFKLQLEKQRVKDVAEAVAADPKLV